MSSTISKTLSPLQNKLLSTIRDIHDYPKEGIVFKDITTVLGDGVLFHECIQEFARVFMDQKIDVIVGAESRGFIFGAALSYLLKASFVPVRKKGKLPSKTISESYELEYGTDTLEMHQDAIKQGQKVLIIDDLLATGGTIQAVEKMIHQLGGDILSCAFLIELSFLKGREKLQTKNIYSMIDYSGE